MLKKNVKYGYSILAIGIFIIITVGLVYLFNKNEENTTENLCLCDRVGLMECADRDQKVKQYNEGLTENSNFKYVEIPYEDRNYVW